MSVEFVKIIQQGRSFGVQASPELPLSGAVARSEEELLGQLLTKFGNVAEGTVVDIERLDHSHLKITCEAPQPVHA